MVGVGIIGFGYWGPNYLRTLKQLSDVDYISVCDSDPKRLESLAKFHIPTFENYAEFLKDSRLDAVIIATPTATHYPLAKDALYTGKHVLVEKPVTLNSSQAQELSDLAKKEQKILATGHIFVYNDGVEYLKKQIYKKEFGKTHEIECIRQSHGPIRPDINVMWDLATHDISILIYLLNDTPTEVASLGIKYRKNTPQEDSIIMGLKFSNDIFGTIKANWQYPIKERRITAICQNKMIRFNDMDPSSPITIYDKSVEPHGERASADYGVFKLIALDGGYQVPALKIREPLMLEVQDFLISIKNKITPKSDGLLGVKVVKVLEAAQISLQNKGAFVEVKK